ncbi:DUF4865 family protein [uncultured Clostridium sp.]|uniref:DUF4865 family protein n=1 Tax=uncultured Clostridium sp. TaxID=59620 RepID=UPI00260B1A3E|nr:DUF4865 family protein [uncultured Clostridium sp.]
MNAMQYKITLPADYNMDIIRKRVFENGYKTDNFKDLLLKAYLIIDTENKKQYAPLYLWKNHTGMNKFIFEGYYDNILSSFGWQHINIGIPLEINFSNNFKESAYILEIEHTIKETNNMNYPKLSNKYNNTLGQILIYNPDKWKYVEFYFFKEQPSINENFTSLYEILHLSL